MSEKNIANIGCRCGVQLESTGKEASCPTCGKAYEKKSDSQIGAKP